MYNISDHGWNLHCRMSVPMRDMADFMHKCSDDPVVRIIATTAMYFALSQTACCCLVEDPFSFLLVNAGKQERDPLDAVMKHFVGMESPKPRDSKNFILDRAIINALLKDKYIPEALLCARPWYSITGENYSKEELLRLTMHQAFGSGRAGLYADRYDDELGWITDVTRHIILRLEREEDRQQFRTDLLGDSPRLLLPKGQEGLKLQVPKHRSIAGSISPSEADAKLVRKTIETAFPLIFLPHCADVPLKIPGNNSNPLPFSAKSEPESTPNAKNMNMVWLGIAMKELAIRPFIKRRYVHDRMANLHKLFSDITEKLRHRLHFFPADYEFFVTRMMREVPISSHLLIRVTANNHNFIEKEEIVQLYIDLTFMVLKGISLSIESLGWYGYGYLIPGDRDRTLQVLETIRKEGSISKRDLQRKHQKLTSECRDEILAFLVEQKLVTVQDNEITAISFAGYWKRIAQQATNELPPAQWNGALPTLLP